MNFYAVVKLNSCSLNVNFVDIVSTEA